MWNLMKSELQRFWRLALGCCLVLMVFLKFASGFGDLFSPSVGNIGLSKLVFMFGGLIFGLYQLGTYRKINRWAYLIHRPLSPGRIFLALAGAAALLLGLALALPLFLTTLMADVMTSQWVDTRHYLTPLFFFGFSFSFYLVGCFIRLSPSRWSFLMFLLPIVFLRGSGQGGWIFLQLAILLGWLGYLVYVSFKPDLSKHLDRPGAIVANSLAAQFVLFGLLVASLTVVYQTGLIFAEKGWNGYAVHAWDDHFAEGTFLDTQYMDGKDALAHGLEAVDSERSRHLRREIELAEVDLVRPAFSGFPVRHQFMHQDKKLSFVDEERGVQWTFSHDRMLFFGRDTTSGAAVGWLGVSGPLGDVLDPSQRFPAVPLIAEGKYFVTRQRLYEWAPDLQRVSLRYELPATESFVGLYQDQGALGAVLTDRALYFFEPKDSERKAGLLTAVAAVPLSGNVKNLESMQMAELIDGTLVSFLFGTLSERGFHEAHQVLVEVGADGALEPLADVPLAQGWPAWYRHRGFLLSPVLQTAQDLMVGATGLTGRTSITVRELAQRALPLQVIVLAFLVALASALLTAWVSRGRDLSPGRRRAWIAAAFLLGVPACLSLLMLTGRSERGALPARSFALPWLQRSAA